MTMSTIGDLRQHFMSTRNTSLIRSELNTLVQELTTGQETDLTEHLGAGQTKLAGVDRQLKILSQFSQSNTETNQFLSLMQSALENVQQYRETSSQTLISINSASSLSQMTDAGRSALSGFEGVVQSLNMRSGDRSIFGGNDFENNAMAASDDIIDELKTAVIGLTDATDVSAAIDTWFNGVGNGFDTLGYQGDTTGNIERSVDPNLSVTVQLRADDQALRDTLKALAVGALAGDTDIPLSNETRQTLMRKSAEDLFSVAASLADVQGRIGFVEAQVEEVSVRNTALETSFGIARNTLTSVDPFETATRLEAVQLQLETHFTLTARLSRLSLTEYLR